MVTALFAALFAALSPQYYCIITSLSLGSLECTTAGMVQYFQVRTGDEHRPAQNTLLTAIPPRAILFVSSVNLLSRFFIY